MKKFTFKVSSKIPNKAGVNKGFREFNYVKNGSCLMSIKNPGVYKFELSLNGISDKAKMYLEANYVMVNKFIEEFNLEKDIKFTWDKENNKYIFENLDINLDPKIKKNTLDYRLYATLIVARYILADDPRYTRLFFNIQRYMEDGLPFFVSYIKASQSEEKNIGDYGYYSFIPDNDTIDPDFFYKFIQLNFHKNLFTYVNEKSKLNQTIAGFKKLKDMKIKCISIKNIEENIKAPYTIPCLIAPLNYVVDVNANIYNLKNNIYKIIGKELTLKGRIKKRSNFNQDKLQILSLYLETTKPQLIQNALKTRK